MFLRKGRSFASWAVVASFTLQTLCLSPVYADGPTADPKKSTKSQAEYEEFMRWKESRQATGENRNSPSDSASLGRTLTLVGGIGLGVTYLTTIIVGVAGPSSSSKDYFIPVVGPFLQSGKVSSPYDTLNILSGAAQAGFLATLITGLVLSSGSDAKSDSGKVSVIPVLTPRQQGVLVGWSL